jgi:succinate dehydrogenase iron-sulfur subunit
MPDAHLRVFRGSPEEEGRFESFDVPVEEGMVVLDALHWIQGHEAPDLAVRWNCKAAKCGSCSAEVDGRPSLTCKTRLSDFDLERPITVEPMRAFPLIRDLVTDVSWNYEVNKTIAPFQPPADVPQEDWRWQQQDIERVQEYRKCIECFLCQDVCHVLRNHETERPFMGPRYLVRTAGLELHPIDQADRRRYLKDSGGIGYCNITKCCTEVCPEHIKITDNAIIPLKERVADEFYDPIQWFWRKLRGRPDDAVQPVELPVLHAAGAPRGVAVAQPEPVVVPEPAPKPARTRRARSKPATSSEAIDPSGDGVGSAPVEATTRPKRSASRSTRPS